VCSAQLWLWPGAGGHSHSVLTDKLLQEKTKFIRVRPLCRSQHGKTTGAAYCASPEQRLSASKKGNFGYGQNLSFAQGKSAPS